MKTTIGIELLRGIATNSEVSQGQPDDDHDNQLPRKGLCRETAPPKNKSGNDGQNHDIENIKPQGEQAAKAQRQSRQILETKPVPQLESREHGEGQEKHNGPVF